MTARRVSRSIGVVDNGPRSVGAYGGGHNATTRGHQMLQATASLMLDDERHPARQIGVAVVGLGHSGPNLLRVLGHNIDARVRWMCDVDSSRLLKWRRLRPDARVTTRLDRVLADPGVDAVVLATPVETHYELTLRALEAGKHVFVETPLATSAAQADDLANVSREARRIVMCGHTLLYSPPVRTVKRMIESRTLGDIYFLSSSRVDLRLDTRVASVIWDLGAHDFSILLYWLSEMPTSVRAIGRDPVSQGVADVAFVAMNFASGVVANVELSWLASSKLRRTVVVGSDRMVVCEDGVPDPVRLFDCCIAHHSPEASGAYPLARRSGDIVSPNIGSCDPLEAQLSDFIHAIRGGDLMEYQTTLARSVVRIAEAADESLRLGGAVISPIADQVPGQLAPRRGLAVV
jgi:predicted dehydrogenase